MIRSFEPANLSKYFANSYTHVLRGHVGCAVHDWFGKWLIGVMPYPYFSRRGEWYAFTYTIDDHEMPSTDYTIVLDPDGFCVFVGPSRHILTCMVITFLRFGETLPTVPLESRTWQFCHAYVGKCEPMAFALEVPRTRDDSLIDWTSSTNATITPGLRLAMETVRLELSSPLLTMSRNKYNDWVTEARRWINDGNMSNCHIPDLLDVHHAFGTIEPMMEAGLNRALTDYNTDPALTLADLYLGLHDFGRVDSSLEGED